MPRVVPRAADSRNDPHQEGGQGTINVGVFVNVVEEGEDVPHKLDGHFLPA
jgi:hypothetical protein